MYHCMNHILLNQNSWYSWHLRLAQGIHNLLSWLSIPVVSLEQTLCYRTGSGLSVCGTRSSCGWPETAAPGGHHICSHTTWPRIYIGLSVAAHEKKKDRDKNQFYKKKVFSSKQFRECKPTLNYSLHLILTIWIILWKKIKQLYIYTISIQ